MKKKMYKAKKRWVVAGIAAAAFLTPTGLVQADENTTDPVVTLVADEATQPTSSVSESSQSLASSEVTLEEVSEPSTPESSFSPSPEVTSTDSQSGFYKRASVVEEDEALEVVPETVSLSSFTATQTEEHLQVMFTEDVPKDSEVRVAVWSQVGNQDDLKWYTLQNGQVSVPYGNHWGYGLYHLHAYFRQKVTGKMTFVKGIELTLEQPKLETEVITTSDASFDVVIANVPKHFQNLYVPTWTSKNGQDDLKWHQATKQADGRYKVTVSLSQHKFETDNYQLHVYGEVSGKKIFLGGTTYNHPKLATQTQVTKVSDDQFTVTVTNVPSYIDTVRIPTWTDKGGQDDIKWYVAQKQTDGSYQFTVNIKDHKYESGKYHIHVYGNAGTVKNIFLNANKTYDVVLPKTETQVEIVSETSFTVTVKNVPSYVSSIVLPTWSSQSGQDDIKWYQGQKQSDGSYTLTVHIKNHKYDTGTYHVHTYGRTSDGKLVFLDGDQVEVKALPKPTATLEIKNVNNQTGTFDVVVSNLTSAAGVKLVQLPTWSEAQGQDDLKWYSVPRQLDGTYRLTVKGSNHKYTSGQYHVHLYVTDESGKRQFVTGTTAEVSSLPKLTGEITLSSVDTSDYTFKTTIANVGAIEGVSKVRVAVWTDSKGQDDLVWADAVKQKDGTYTVLTRLANHSYSGGKYHVHVYYKLNNGQLEYLGRKEQNVSNITIRPNVKKDVDELLSAYKNIFAGMPGKKSIFISPLDGTELAMIDSGPQRAASAIKLFILAAAHAKETRGELNLSQEYTIRSSDIVEASTSLTGKVGHTYKLSEIASFMIQTSDNTATNIMIDRLGGIKGVNDEIRRMGYNETTLNRRMRISSEINRGLENYISVHEAGDLIKNIINGSLRDVDGESKMKQDLNKNIHNYWLTNQTRPVATVYDKPGNDGRYGVENDVSVISKNGRGYVVAILTHESGSNGLTYSNLFARFGSVVANKL